MSKLAALRDLWKSATAVTGLILIGVILLLALFGPWIAPADPLIPSPLIRLQGPSTAHLFGTDSLGRDILSRVIYGARISLMIGVISVTISLVPGTLLGLLSGYFGKRIDSVIMRCMDMLLAFPAILLAIFITAILEPSLTNTMVAVGIVYIPHYARIVRSSVLSLKGLLFVQAVSHLGGSHARILFKHILPNCLPPIIVYATLGMGTAVLQSAAPPSVIHEIRGNQISMIFQEPMTSLNPVYRVGFQIMEPLKKHRGMKTAAARQEALGLLDLVGIPEPRTRIDDYPHQFSGGMRQRVMIAMALACHPALMIADEPTTALDVTIQAQILELIKKLQKEIGMAVMLITHDLGVVAETSHRVVVMYAGKIVESADVSELFARPAHPYTRGLFDSLPTRGCIGPLPTIRGAVPSLLNLPPGCAFQDRCDTATPQCRQSPPWQAVTDGHGVRCWYPLEVA